MVRITVKRKKLKIRDLLKYERNDKIKLQPDYQRGYIWNERAKYGLIDTILEKRVEKAPSGSK